jgi:hypothetical protein
MIAKDKQLHVLAGFAAGIFPALFAFGGGLLVAIAAGAAKEYDDAHGKTRGVEDNKDILATIAGGLLAELWVAFWIYYFR